MIRLEVEDIDHRQRWAEGSLWSIRLALCNPTNDR